MVQKAKKNYLNNLNVRNITDNKQFSKTSKPFFSSKVSNNERITLLEGDKAVSEEREVAETFKSYFETIVENLGINSKFMSEEPVNNKSVNNIIRKFQNHLSIIKSHMWRRWGTPQNIFFTFIDELEKQIIITKTVKVGQ